MEKEADIKRRCSICKVPKPLSDFHKEKCRKYGVSYSCKVCNNRLTNEYKARVGYYRTEKFRQSYKQKGRTKYEHRKVYLNRYAKLNRDKINARITVRLALRKGKINKLPCEKCGSKTVQAHHHLGYDKKHWLDIIWLCHNHHVEVHHV